MPMPKVTTKVVDLSTRVTSEGTYNAAIVVAAKKGPINKPTLVTSQTDFLERFTPDETLEIGWDGALYEAYIYLAQNSNLYVVRAANTTTDPALYGGCHIRLYNSELENKSFDKGYATEDEINALFDEEIDTETAANTALIIYGANQGAYNDNIAVTIVTDPAKVKLDGAFIVNVWKNKVLVETHTCSLNPSLKNGYGVNCFAEDVLKASNYVRADVNDDDELLKNISYELNVKGIVTFKNEVVEAIKAAKAARTDLTVKRIHTYVQGDIVKVASLENVNGYYKCTVAGTTAKEVDMPDFTEDNAYLQTVEDGTCTWELQEVIRTYGTAVDFNKGEIAVITTGSNTYYYRAMVSGTTGSTKPNFNDEPENYTIEDGTITFVNVTQEEQVTADDLIGYTFLKKQKDETLPLDRYTVYGDIYLAAPLELEKSIFIENPTTLTHDKVTLDIDYTATYSGRASDAHYIMPKATDGLVELFGGYDGGQSTQTADKIRALKTLQNMNDINIQLIMDGGETTPTFQRAIADVCDYREMSCQGIISTPYVNEMGMVSGDPQKDVVDYRNYQLNANTRKLELYTTHQLVYDEFNDRNIYVSPSCFVASRIMNVAQEYGWHWAAAGYNRGVINSLDVANTFDPSEVDTFSDAQINTIIKEPGYGNVIFDELTMQAKASDLQDAHITRYLDLYLRPRLKTALKNYLFEFNDEQTRNLIVKMLNTFLDPEVSARALYDYRVVCDTTNNKPRDIQNNVCNVWIFLQVMKIMKFIKCSLIVTPYGVSFDELGYTG